MILNNIAANHHIFDVNFATFLPRGICHFTVAKPFKIVDPQNPLEPEWVLTIGFSIIHSSQVLQDTYL